MLSSSNVSDFPSRWANHERIGVTVESDSQPGVGVHRIEIQGFRSARHVVFSPGRLCALVGEARAGKSTLLAAIRAVLDPQSAPLSTDDVTEGETQVSVRADLATGITLILTGPPSAITNSTRSASPVLFLPASERAGDVVSPFLPGSGATEAVDIFRGLLAEHRDQQEAPSTTDPALALVEAVEQCCRARAKGMVLLIEEPELYLRPQTQRYLYRLLRELSLNGNQVIYSTHSPALLNVARLHELGFVTRSTETGTQILHPEPVTAEDEFRLLSEFDAERSELFLAHAAILVEGTTEKLALPFVFRALGYDADRNGITVVECGGKPGIPLIARVCKAVGVPFLAVHDRDAQTGAEPIDSERHLNYLIAELAGLDRTIVLTPDFEAVAGIKGHTHKPQRAWQRFTSLGPAEMPEPLVRTVELAVELSREHQA